MKIPFDFSIDDWIYYFRRVFTAFANFLKEAFNIDFFDSEDHFPTESHSDEAPSDQG